MWLAIARCSWQGVLRMRPCQGRDGRDTKANERGKGIWGGTPILWFEGACQYLDGLKCLCYKLYFWHLCMFIFRMCFKSENSFYRLVRKCRLVQRHTPQYLPLWPREKLQLGGVTTRKWCQQHRTVQRAMDIWISQWTSPSLSFDHEEAGPLLDW